MQVFRIARKKYIKDLTGLGAKLYGGRWNMPGTAVIYTSETRSLALVEFLVHISLPDLPQDIQMATLEIKGSPVLQNVSPHLLPKNWQQYPSPEKLARLGTEWARSNRSLFLRVPSAVVDREYNLLINPVHSDMSLLTIIQVEDLKLDKRLIRSRV